MPDVSTARDYTTPSTDRLVALDGHRTAVVGLEFLGGGTLLASLSRDRSPRLWDLETGHLLGVWEGAGGAALVLLAAEGVGQIATLYVDNLAEFRCLPRTTLRTAIAEIGAALTLGLMVSHALCDQLRITGLSGADQICGAP